MVFTLSGVARPTILAVMQVSNYYYYTGVSRRKDNGTLKSSSAFNI